MRVIADKAGFILADLKLEFGKFNDEILLGDSIGPDEFRLWPKDSYKIGKTQKIVLGGVIGFGTIISVFVLALVYIDFSKL